MAKDKTDNSEDRDGDSKSDHKLRNQKPGSHRALIENLLVYLTDRVGYVESARQYVADEYRYRVGLFTTGTVFFALALVGVVCALVLLIYSAFLLLSAYTENPALSAFLIAWLAVLFGAAFLMLALGQYRDVAGKRKNGSRRRDR